jgi:hypothetical protein
MTGDPEPAFGDTVRILSMPATVEAGFAGRTGSVFGESIPSSSGVGPVIGEDGSDYALSVYFEDTDEQEWFAPNVVEFVDHGGEQEWSLDGGPAFSRDADGQWREQGAATPPGWSFNPPVPAGTPGRRPSLWRRIFRRQRHTGSS